MMQPNPGQRLPVPTEAISKTCLSIAAVPPKPPGTRRPVVVCSGSGKAAEVAMERLKAGADPLDAVVEAVAVHEADPGDHSVGYGGTPNEDGVVELDASLMHGKTHGAAGVAGLRNIMHPAAVARAVLRHTRHVLMIGDYATRFAREHGFPEVDLLTPQTRQAWIAWKEAKYRGHRHESKLASLAPDVRAINEKVTHGTVHCSVLDTHGDLAGGTSTSGLGYKVPGRVGDSPIIGAGLYLDNEVGSCGSVGMGELNLVNCASYLLIENLRRGMTRKDAIVAVLKRINEVTVRDPRFRNPDGTLAFGVSFYVLTKNGNADGASIGVPKDYYVHDGDRVRKMEPDVLFA